MSTEEKTAKKLEQKSSDLKKNKIDVVKLEINFEICMYIY